MDKKEQLNRFLDKFLNDESIDFDELEVDETFAELFEISVLLKKEERIGAKSREKIFDIVHTEFNENSTTHKTNLFSIMLQFLSVIFGPSYLYVDGNMMTEDYILCYRDSYPNAFSSSLKSSQFLYNYTISSFMIPLGLKTLC